MGLPSNPFPLSTTTVQTYESGPLYLKSVDCTDHLAEGGEKDAEYVADGFIDTIKDVGGKPEEGEMKMVKDCVQIVGDGAAVNQAAWRLIEDRFPWIFCSWCIPHVTNLFFKDCCKQIPEINSIIERAEVINSWFRGHQRPAAMLSANCFKRYKKTLSLIRPTDTRFGLYFIMIHRLLRVQDGLEDTVKSEEYLGEGYVDDTAARYVLDVDFWQRAKALLQIMWPPMLILRFGDSDKPGTSKMYHYSKQVTKLLEDLEYPGVALPYGDKVLELWKGRVGDMLGDIHFAAAALDPQYHDLKYWEDPRVARGLDAAMQKALMVYESAEERRAKCIYIAKELEIYKMKQGVFAYEMTWLSAIELSAAAWWAKYKAEVPTLSWFAQRITAQVVSSSASERGHKANRKVSAKRLLAPRAGCDIIMMNPFACVVCLCLLVPSDVF